MIRESIILSAAILFLFPGLYGQADKNPPVSPSFTWLSVRESDGKPVLMWNKSPSTDVAGYVIYYYVNGEGHAIDTIRNPNITTYINTGSASQYFIESYVIAAIDSSGNLSPLSNDLNTVMPVAVADSCKGIIHLTWNSYKSTPVAVTGYSVLVSENGGAFIETGQTSQSVNTFDFAGVQPLVSYCFRIHVNFPGGSPASSTTVCKQVRMQRFPEWLNADYVTAGDDRHLSLSFSVDPLSGLDIYRIKRMRLSDGSVSTIATMGTSDNRIEYNDISSNSNSKYRYWLEAVNDCGITALESNPASNMVLTASPGNEKIMLNWNPYRSWEGGINNYSLFINSGTGFTQKLVVSSADTSMAFDYHEIMYEVSADSVCLYITGRENPDLYGVTGESRSNTICISPEERITVPNAFTPDNDNLNDVFRPVLSFTPVRYQLIITDRQNNKVFESTDYLGSWDGTKGGSPLPPDVYLWYLRVKTPSGKNLSRTGTVVIVKSR